MRIERQLQDLLDTLRNLRSSNTELKEKLKEASQTIKNQGAANKELIRQNKLLRLTDSVLDGLDEERLFEQEARIDFLRSLDGRRTLKVRSLRTGVQTYHSEKGPILQQGVRETVGRKECPVEA